VYGVLARAWEQPRNGPSVATREHLALDLGAAAEIANEVIPTIYGGHRGGEGGRLERRLYHNMEDDGRCGEDSQE
jgi:hypothetical protein